MLDRRTAASYAEALAAGANLGEAAAIAGINRNTVQRWKRRLVENYGDIDTTLGSEPIDDGHRPPIAELISFFTGAKRAEANAVLERLGRIRQAGERGVWQADAWWLERRFPDRFGRRQPDRAPATDEPVFVRITFDGVEDRAEDPGR